MPDTELEPPFPAYVGDAPFIFVSYAHKDAAVVFPELQELHALGCRIWYDEGIDPGNEWPEEIANAVDRCAHFLVFISPAAAASRNVRNEIHYALRLGKDFLAVHLSETKLPQGLELSISAIQAVFRYQMSPQNYWRKMEKALPEIVRAAPPESPRPTKQEEGRKPETDSNSHEIVIPTIPTLVAALNGPDYARAVIALEKIGAPAIPALVAALNGPGGNGAIVALAGIGVPAIPALAAALNGPGRGDAAVALEKIGVAAIPALVAALSGPSIANSANALRGIGAPAIPTLVGAIDGPGGVGAVLPLEHIGAPAIPALVEALNGSASGVAALALARIGASATPALVEALSHSDHRVRIYAAHALGLLGPEAAAAIPSLKALLNGFDSEREVASKAIAKITA